MVDKSKLDEIIAQTHQDNDTRSQGYRAQALKMYPWVCGRCSREFTHKNLRELTVHHRDHNHDNNPSDGSNWELLCVYCHDNEHQRYEEYGGKELDSSSSSQENLTNNPFADLKSMLDPSSQK